MSGDTWDWPYILYIGRVWLGYTDDEIWQMTPRKFKSQMDVHMDVQKQMNGTKSASNNKVQDGYIDQLANW